MKKILMLIMCLMLLCGMVLFPACTVSHDSYHSHDLPPDWTPTTPLPDDAIILNDETGIPDVALYIAILNRIDWERSRHFRVTGEGTFTAGEAAAVTWINISPLGHSNHVDEDISVSDLGWEPLRNFRGIEHLRSLEEIDLTLQTEWGLVGGLDNFNELRRLEHLPHLRTLRIDTIFTRANDLNPSEHLNDLMPLRNLIGLTTLEIFSSSLTSLDGIQYLTNLEYFTLYGRRQNLQDLRQRYS